MTIAVQTPQANLAQLSTGGHVPLLDGWRGLAIVLVLQAHFAPIAGLDLGQFGVDAFFSLSGLLMANILFIRRTPLAVFYRRRVARILPAFVLFVCIIYGLAWLAGQGRSGTEWAATLLFLRTYWPAEPDIWNTGLPIGHLWSLNIEEHSYLLLSLVAVLGLTRRVQAVVLLALGLACIGVFYYYGSLQHPPPSFENRTESAAMFLLFGAGYHLVRPQERLPWLGWLALGLVLAAASMYRHGAPWWGDTVLSPLALALAVNHADELPGPVQRLLAWPVLRQVGVWSYSIYLWQQPFFQFQAQFTAPLALLLALGTALASYYLVEQPCRRWLTARRASASAPPPAAPAADGTELSEPHRSDFIALLQQGAGLQDISTQGAPANGQVAHTLGHAFVRRELGRVQAHLTHMVPLLLAHGAGGPRALDVGCSTGGTTAALVLGFKGQLTAVTGVDPNALSISAASLRMRGLGIDHTARVQVVNADEPLPFADASFELVTAVSVLEFIPTAAARQRFLGELCRVLAPGGHLYLATPSRWTLRELHSRRWLGNQRPVAHLPWASPPGAILAHLHPLQPVDTRTWQMRRLLARLGPWPLVALAPLLRHGAFVLPWQKMLFYKPTTEAAHP